MMKKISSDWNSELIRQSDLDDMARQKQIDVICSKAIRYIGISTKSSGRIRAYLQAQDVSDWLIEAAMHSLLQRGYLDDNAVAARVMRQRSGKRAVSRKAIRHYLQAAGLPEEIINDASAQYPSDSETIQQVLTAKFNVPDVSLKARMIRFLGSRGYSSGLAIRTVSDYLDNKLNDNQ